MYPFMHNFLDEARADASVFYNDGDLLNRIRGVCRFVNQTKKKKIYVQFAFVSSFSRESRVWCAWSQVCLLGTHFKNRWSTIKLQTGLAG